MKLFHICYGRNLYDYSEHVTTESVRVGDNYPAQDEIDTIVRNHKEYAAKGHMMCWTVIFTLDMSTGAVEVHFSHKKPLKSRVEVNVEAKKTASKVRTVMMTEELMTAVPTPITQEMLDDLTQPQANLTNGTWVSSPFNLSDTSL